MQGVSRGRHRRAGAPPRLAESLPARGQRPRGASAPVQPASASSTPHDLRRRRPRAPASSEPNSCSQVARRQPGDLAVGALLRHSIGRTRSTWETRAHLHSANVAAVPVQSLVGRPGGGSATEQVNRGVLEAADTRNVPGGRSHRRRARRRHPSACSTAAWLIACSCMCCPAAGNCHRPTQPAQQAGAAAPASPQPCWLWGQQAPPVWRSASHHTTPPRCKVRQGWASRHLTFLLVAGCRVAW